MSASDSGLTSTQAAAKTEKNNDKLGTRETFLTESSEKDREKQLIVVELGELTKKTTDDILKEDIIYTK